MFVLKDGIPAEDFYGGKTIRQEKVEAILKLQNKNCQVSHPYSKRKTRLLGPSETWKVFKKQQDAIDCCLIRRNGLMPFAFEDINMRRMFLAAHPKVFWELNRDRFFKNCNTYEIIKEHSPCKLYLDIEFEYAYNENKNGENMLNNLLEIININLKNFFNISCTRNDALDLDSSSDTKFSHHVIYEIKNMAFLDNYTVGNVIKQICSELRNAFESNLSGESTKLNELSEKYNLSQNDILELFVSDRKSQIKLLIDEGVYTKNRHFRMLGSSKKTKNVPLKISKSNKYTPHEESNPLDLFLDSLVTYFSWKIERILEFSEPLLCRSNKNIERSGNKINLHSVQESFSYSPVDSFVNCLISPNGRIRKKVFFSSNSTIVYDIQGFRFCENIKREHKSNNIKYIVSLENMSYYQKCYDPDCLDFCSDIKQLPSEVCFLLENDNLFGNKDLEEKFVETLEKIQSEYSFEECVPDEELENVAKCAEAVLDVDW